MKSLHRYLLGSALALGLFATSYTPAQAFIGISIGIAPPPLPFSVQPACPGDGYLWTPGYWAWDGDDQDYYYVPGSWVLAPEFGLLWTPCWWGWSDNAYYFHSGYWGRDVGFYGGINYGFGYGGHGYAGGYYRGNHFFYNRAVNNVGGIAASRTFSRAVNANGSRVAFNGGNGGVNAAADPTERRAESEHHVNATSAQTTEVRAARTDPSQRFNSNHGSPQVTGTTRAGNFRGTQASAATGESRTGAGGDPAFTGESRHASAAGDTAFTGVTQRAQDRSSANAGTEEHHAQQATSGERSAQERQTRVASEERRAEENRSSERTAAIERSHVSEAHAMANHEASHSSNFAHASSMGGGGGFHPAAQHSGGGGGGFAHASAGHVGGGGGHTAGGAGAHPGGGPGHH